MNKVKDSKADEQTKTKQTQELQLKIQQIELQIAQVKGNSSGTAQNSKQKPSSIQTQAPNAGTNSKNTAASEGSIDIRI